MAHVVTATPADVNETQTAREELEALYDAHAAHFLACAIAIVGCRDRAEDQDTRKRTPACSRRCLCPHMTTI